MEATSLTTSATTGNRTLPGLLLRLEGLAVLLAAIILYAQQGWNGFVFAALLLVPDLGMVGYAVNERVGARLYNVFHLYALPMALLVGALLSDWNGGAQIAAIWFAHIGGDRALGYGLKYASGFKDTHLQRV